MHEDKINNLKDPDNQNELLEVLIKTTLAMIIIISLALEVEIITEIEVGHKTETTIYSTEPLLENVVEKDLTDLPTDYPHPIIIIQKKWKTLLDNSSIRSALSAHLSHEAKTIFPTTSDPTTTPVKCNIKLSNRSYQAIIDSGASISMITHK
ncbi:11870_t:CDS:2, partial [Cetraspora pellucida]